jgi:hypothetical protein
MTVSFSKPKEISMHKIAATLFTITFLTISIPSNAANLFNKSPQKIVAHSINSIADGAKIAAKLALCLYASYLCIDRGCKAAHLAMHYIKNVDFKNLLNNISKPAKHALIFVGLGLVAYECYQSLRYDLKRE